MHAATDTDFFAYSGAWIKEVDPKIPNTTDPAPYYYVDSGNPSVSFSFLGTGVAINGSRNWEDWTYVVVCVHSGALISVLILGLQELDNQTSSYNASTCWFLGDALLFYRDGLDPGQNHTVTLTPQVNGGLKFWLNSATILNSLNATSTNTTTSGSGHPSSSGASRSVFLSPCALYY